MATISVFLNFRSFLIRTFLVGPTAAIKCFEPNLCLLSGFLPWHGLKFLSTKLLKTSVVSFDEHQDVFESAFYRRRAIQIFDLSQLVSLVVGDGYARVFFAFQETSIS